MNINYRKRTLFSPGNKPFSFDLILFIGVHKYAAPTVKSEYKLKYRKIKYCFRSDERRVDDWCRARSCTTSGSLTGGMESMLFGVIFVVLDLTCICSHFKLDTSLLLWKVDHDYQSNSYRILNTIKIN